MIFAVTQKGKPMTNLTDRQAGLNAVGINTWAGQRLLKVPSAQPEIIHCNDCKWWDFAPDNTMLPDWHRCRWYGRMHTRYEDFCSRAERRTDE